MKKGIVAALSTVLGVCVGTMAVKNMGQKKLKKWQNLNQKNDAILQVFCQWIRIKQEGKSLVEHLLEKGYKTIAVYGMHYLGECLIDELKNSGIEVKYAIDQNAEYIFSEVDIYTPESELEEVDAVVVTAFYFFDEIEEELCKKLDCPIISFEDIIYEM